MSEAENYQRLQEAKNRLRKALEDIVRYDIKIGGDGAEGTFNGEVFQIVNEIFPDFLNY